MPRAETKSTATRRRLPEVSPAPTFADLTRGDEWENPLRDQSPEPCERFAALLEAIATQGEDPLCGPRARRALDVEFFLERLGWESFACWVGSARGTIRAVQSRALAARVVEKIRAVDKLMLSLALSASRCPGGSEIDAFDDYVDDDLSQAAERGLCFEPFASHVEEINREEDDLVRYLADCAMSLRAFAAEIKAAPARIVVVAPYEPTLTAKQAGEVLFPGEALGTARVCDRFRRERTPPELQMFCTGGSGRDGKHFIARVVHEVAASARSTLDEITRRATEAREREVAARERDEYRAEVASKYGLRHQRRRVGN